LLAMITGLAIPFGGAAVESAITPSPPQKNQGEPAARNVQGQVLTSRELPAVRLRFDNDFKYAGTQDFILYGVARAEQHFFVDADKQGRVKRLYWVQFEGYLPDNTHTYRYVANKTVNLGGLDFIADAYFRNLKAEPGRPDSDGSRARAYLDSKGYRMASDDVMVQRLVHLVDDSKRNELMIIYMEDLSIMGLTVADLGANGSAAARRDDIMKGLLERAQKSMKIER
jgi:hypothetical protein